jgi:hypothetical protein
MQFMCPEKRRTERWKRIAELAATEQDPQKLADLVTELNRALEKETRLSAESIRRANPASTTHSNSV